MGFNFGGWIKNTYKTVANEIAPIINPIKNIGNTVLNPIISSFQTMGSITTNLFKAGGNLSQGLATITSGNTLLYIGGGIAVIALIYVIKK